MPVRKKRKTTSRSKTTAAKRKKSTTRRKTTARSAAASREKTTVKKRKTTAKKRTTTKTTAIRSKLTKSQILQEIAESAELNKKQVAQVFEELSYLMERSLKKGGAGEFTVPGLMKCVVKRKPATKARKGLNPFTGEEITFKAKPARNVVKVRALKKLKEMVE